MSALTQSQLEELLQQLSRLRSEMLVLETSGLVGCADIHPDHTGSARNLMHYLALRRHDICHLTWTTRACILPISGGRHTLHRIKVWQLRPSSRNTSTIADWAELPAGVAGASGPRSCLRVARGHREGPRRLQ